MAARASRLHVYDYVGGKTDWLNRGLAYEGSADLISRHLTDGSTCEVTDTVAEVGQRFGAVEVVVVSDGMVVGVLNPASETTAASVESLMKFGITTVRPSEERAELDDRLAAAGVSHAVVTDPAARFLGPYLTTKASSSFA